MRVQPQDPSASLAARAALGGAAAGRAKELADELRQSAGVAAPSASDPRGAKAAAQKLEAVFATLLVKEMRATQSGGIFGEGTSGDVYGGWFDQYVGDVLAQRRALHLAESIERSLARKEAPQP